MVKVTQDLITTIKPDDCVTLNSNTSVPFVAKILETYETHDGEKMIKCQWYYRPGDLQPRSLQSSSHPNELFLSNLTDTNYIGSILGKVRVLTQETDGDVVRGPFFCRSSYDPKTRSLRPISQQRAYMSSSTTPSKKKKMKKKKKKTKKNKSSISGKKVITIPSSSDEDEDSSSSNVSSEPRVGAAYQVTTIPTLRTTAPKSPTQEPIYKPLPSILVRLSDTLDRVRKRLCEKSVGHIVRFSLCLSICRTQTHTHTST